MEQLKKRGNRKLTEAEKKNILLDITKENRSYDLNSVLDEDEWNYEKDNIDTYDECCRHGFLRPGGS